MSARARAHSHRLVEQWGLRELNDRLMDEIGLRVVSGPFAGLTITAMPREDHIGPYVLGTYEMELHPWWERLLHQRFAQFVDIGAKFGYYAVGLARLFPGTPVVAFDTDWWARRALREMAGANGVTGIEIRSFCGPEWLQVGLCDQALIVSDCEGYEGDLFRHTDSPALATATLIVETHECFVRGVLSDVIGRFARTHDIEQVESRSSAILPPVSVRSLTADELRRASLEVRPPQTWVLLTPKVAR